MMKMHPLKQKQSAAGSGPPKGKDSKKLGKNAGKKGPNTIKRPTDEL